jgi:hypothetical protein
MGIIYPHYWEALDADITSPNHLVVMKAIATPSQKVQMAP